MLSGPAFFLGTSALQQTTVLAVRCTIKLDLELRERYHFADVWSDYIFQTRISLLTNQGKVDTFPQLLAVSWKDQLNEIVSQAAQSIHLISCCFPSALYSGITPC